MPSCPLIAGPPPAKDAALGKILVACEDARDRPGDATRDAEPLERGDPALTTVPSSSSQSEPILIAPLRGILQRFDVDPLCPPGREHFQRFGEARRSEANSYRRGPDDVQVAAQ